MQVKASPTGHYCKHSHIVNTKILCRFASGTISMIKTNLLAGDDDDQDAVSRWHTHLDG